MRAIPRSIFVRSSMVLWANGETERGRFHLFIFVEVMEDENLHV